MVRELITIQVGQCGNQIGSRFWEMALRENAAYNAKGLYDDSIASLFRNLDCRKDPPRELKQNAKKSNGSPIRISTLKARAVLVDMECGVLNNMLKGPLGSLFDARQLVADVSGAGNNWAHGYHEYGQRYGDIVMDKVRIEAERCDALQGVVLLHSLGGGTGSGLGSRIMEQLQDDLPGPVRISAPVLPSHHDDVIVSPYNALLALDSLSKSAELVIPADNAALHALCAQVDKEAAKKGMKGQTLLHGGATKHPAFAHVNGILASLLLHLASTTRLSGQLNTDLSDLGTNLVPYPSLVFALPSMAPLVGSRDVAAASVGAKGVDKLMSQLCQPSNYLVNCNPRKSTCLAAALLLRGDVSIDDVVRNVPHMQRQYQLAFWNSEAFKVGLCSTPPPGVPLSGLNLTASCAFAYTLKTIHSNFNAFFSKKRFLHHLTSFMPECDIGQAAEDIDDLAATYQLLDGLEPPENIPKYKYSM